MCGKRQGSPCLASSDSPHRTPSGSRGSKSLGLAAVSLDGQRLRLEN